MIMLFIMFITGILLLCKLLCLVQESYYYYYSYGYAYYRNPIIMHIVMLVAGILFLSFL